MRRLFYGYRRVTQELKANGWYVNKKCVQRLMRLGGDPGTLPWTKHKQAKQKTCDTPLFIG